MFKLNNKNEILKSDMILGLSAAINFAHEIINSDKWISDNNKIAISISIC